MPDVSTPRNCAGKLLSVGNHKSLRNAGVQNEDVLYLSTVVWVVDESSGAMHVIEVNFEADDVAAIKAKIEAATGMPVLSQELRCDPCLLPPPTHTHELARPLTAYAHLRRSAWRQNVLRSRTCRQTG